MIQFAFTYIRFSNLLAHSVLRAEIKSFRNYIIVLKIYEYCLKKIKNRLKKVQVDKKSHIFVQVKIIETICLIIVSWQYNTSL